MTWQVETTLNSGQRIWGGTNAERLAYAGINPNVGDLGIESDGDKFEWRGAWVQIGTGGAALTSSQNGGASIIPSNYAASPVALSQAGDGYAIASGARYIQVGMTTETAGSAVLLAFGTSELDAEDNVDGTVGSEVGMMILGGAVIGKISDPLGVPRDPLITHFAIAENHAVPTGDCIITQGA